MERCRCHTLSCKEKIPRDDADQKKGQDHMTRVHKRKSMQTQKYSEEGRMRNACNPIVSLISLFLQFSILLYIHDTNNNDDRYVL